MKNRWRTIILAVLLLVAVVYTFFGTFYGKYVQEMEITRLLNVVYGSDVINLLPGLKINAMMSATHDAYYTEEMALNYPTDTGTKVAGNHGNIYHIEFGGSYSGFNSSQMVPKTSDYVVCSSADGYFLKDISGFWDAPENDADFVAKVMTLKDSNDVNLTQALADALLAKRIELIADDTLDPEERIDSFISYIQQQDPNVSDETAALIAFQISGRSSNKSEHYYAATKYFEAVGAERANEATDRVPCYIFYDSSSKTTTFGARTSYTCYHFNSEQSTPYTREDNPTDTTGTYDHKSNNFFAGLSGLQDINFISGSQIDTSDVTSFVHFFKGCGQLSDYSAQSFIARMQVQSADDITGMFQRMTRVTIFDLSHFNLSRQPMDLSWLFERDTNLKTVIFPEGDKAVTAIKGEGLRSTFKSCYEIEFIDLSRIPLDNFTDGKTENYNGRYNNSSKMRTITEVEGSDGWYESYDWLHHGADLSSCFMDCRKLRTIVVQDDFEYGFTYDFHNNIFKSNSELVGGSGTAYADVLAAVGEDAAGRIDYAVLDKYLDTNDVDPVTSAAIKKPGFFTKKTTGAKLTLHYRDGSTVVLDDVLLGDTVNLDVYAPDDASFVGWAYSSSAMDENLSEIAHVQVQGSTTVDKNEDLYAVYHDTHQLNSVTFGTNSIKSIFDKYELDFDEVLFCRKSELPEGAVRYADASADMGHVGIYVYEQNGRTVVAFAVEKGGASVTLAQNSQEFFKGRTRLKKVSSTIEVKTPENANINFMFQNCANLSDVNGFLAHFDMSEVNQAYRVFENCTSLTELDFTGSNFDGVKQAGNIFAGCTSLKTIYVDADFTNSNMENGHCGTMFYNCPNLVGERGTVYNSGHTDQNYAVIDAPGTPGYLSVRRAQVTLTYDPVAGSSGIIAFQTGNSGLPMVISSAAEPTAPEGQSFSGWSASSSGTVQYHSGDSLTITENSTLYAIYEDLQYKTLTYDVNGGTGGPVPSSATYEAGSSVTVSSAAVIPPEGKVFLGWSENPAATVADGRYDPDDVITLNSNLTLYAVYRDVSATVIAKIKPNPRLGTESTSDFWTIKNALTYSTSHCDIIYCTEKTLPAEGLRQVTYSMTTDDSEAEIEIWGKDENSVTKIYICVKTPDNAIIEFPSDMRYYFSISHLDNIIANPEIEFDTSKVTDCSYMLNASSHIYSIVVPASFDFTGAAASSWMFGNTPTLVGGNGTAFDAGHRDCSYACVDMPGQPGYFTLNGEAETGEQLTLSFDPNGGTSGAVTSMTVSSGSIVSIPAGAKTTPPQGQKQIGWALSSSATAADYAVNGSLSISSDTTLYAVYAEARIKFKAPADDNPMFMQAYWNKRGSTSVTDCELFICNLDSLPAGITSSDLVTADLSDAQDGSIKLYGKLVNDPSPKVMIYVCVQTHGPTVVELNENSRKLFCGTSGYLKNITIDPDITLDSSNVENFFGMFSNLGMEVLDISWVDFSSATNVSNLFNYSSTLTTIYAAAGTDLSDVTNGTAMFSNCYGLRGGEGTAFTGTQNDKSWAHIDTAGNPGLFTLKP